MTELGSCLSVVVLVHNDETTLPRCLDSIQNLRALGAEVVIVDDGSTDQSSMIVRSWSAKFGATLLTRAWSGVGRSRNVGLMATTNRWVTFLDSDDRIEVEGILEALVIGTNSDADVIRSTNRIIGECSGQIREVGLVPNREARFNSRSSSLIEPSTGLHGVIYSRDYLFANRIRFHDCQMGEDLIFNLEVLAGEPKFAEVSSIGYTYSVGRSDQLTSKTYSATRLLCDFDSVLPKIRDLPQVRRLYWHIILRSMAGAIRREPREIGTVTAGLYRRSQSLPRGTRESLWSFLRLLTLHWRQILPSAYSLIVRDRGHLSTFR